MVRGWFGRGGLLVLWLRGPLWDSVVYGCV